MVALLGESAHTSEPGALADPDRMSRRWSARANSNG
jgi:hypothetical protein